MIRLSRAKYSVILALLVAACGDDYVERSTRVIYDPQGENFWDLPFPSDVGRGNPTFALTELPVDFSTGVADMWLEAAQEVAEDGFGLASGAYLRTTSAIDPATLPANPAASLGVDASAYLVALEGPARGRRIPLTASVLEADAYTPENVVALIPEPGFILQEHTRYAGILTDRVRDRSGEPLGRSREFHDGLEALGLGLPGKEKKRIAGAAVFTTGAPRNTMKRLAEWVEAQPGLVPSKPWTVLATFDDYVVIETAVSMPIFVTGTPPYIEEGELEIIWDASGMPSVAREETVPVAISIPRRAQPSDGFPLMLYLHGSGGRYTQFFTRGPRNQVPEHDSLEPEPGTGPALTMARRGIAVASFDFPQHGTRLPPGTQASFLGIVSNAKGTVTEQLVGAAESLFISRFLADLELDPAVSNLIDPGAESVVSFDDKRLTGFGQSKGSTIGVLWASVDPRADAFVFSGAGGLLIEIGTGAQEPYDAAALLALMLDLPEGTALTRTHPVLHAAQIAWDLSDPVIHGSVLANEASPRPVLMAAGNEDLYFSTNSQTALAVTLGVSIAGETDLEEWAQAMELAGRDSLQEPVLNPRVVVPFEAPHSLGHDVMFNQPEALYQWSCFLASAGENRTAALPKRKQDASAPCP